MGLPLIALTSFWSGISSVLGVVWVILLVLAGLNFIILVHELGHFLVAKLCGVKCEKFYIWFDVFGYRFLRLKWGETEYGLGWLPLGGYVKMLGQEDNPARLREEIARAKAQQAAGGASADPPPEPPTAHEPRTTNQPRPTNHEPRTTNHEPLTAHEPRTTNHEPTTAEEPPIDLAAAEEALYNPRSYLAQSVPKRMAIISAGVIMNVIFAFVLAVWAYGLGVFQPAGGVGQVAPGEAAWQANLRPGDRVLRINGKPVERFDDLRNSITLGDIDHGLSIEVQRPGVPEPFTVHVNPDRTGLAPTIGVAQPLTPVLAKLPAYPGTAAAEARPALKSGDKVVEVAGHPTTHYAEIYSQFALHPGGTLPVTVERGAGAQEAGKTKEAAVPERISVEVPPQPVYRLGLVMTMGPVTAVQSKSPAEEAGVGPTDVLTEIDGQPVGDPMTLAERLRVRAERGDRVRLTVQRDGQSRTLPEVTLRNADWYDTPFKPLSPMSVPALGIAYEVPPEVAAVLKGSPAAEAGIQAGATVVRAKLIPPGREELEKLDLGSSADKVRVKEITLDFVNAKDRVSWPWFFSFVQESLPGRFQVQLFFADGASATMTPAPAEGWSNPDRGFVFSPKGEIVKGKDFASDVRLGYEETRESLLLVYRFLTKIGTQVSAKSMGGPISIAQMAYHHASQGTPELLLFLTLISANLAVINFLPIPVLDGGHMVFLLYEGVTGRAPDERVQAALTWAGLVFILGLMIWVFGLDISRLLSLG